MAVGRRGTHWLVAVGVAGLALGGCGRLHFEAASRDGGRQQLQRGDGGAAGDGSIATVDGSVLTMDGSVATVDDGGVAVEDAASLDTDGRTGDGASSCGATDRSSCEAMTGCEWLASRCAPIGSGCTSGGPFDPAPVMLAGVDAAIAGITENCSGYCTITGVQAYAYSTCRVLTFDEIYLSGLLPELRDPMPMSIDHGGVLARDPLRLNGGAVLLAIDAAVGATAGNGFQALEAWQDESEVACSNCTRFVTTTVLLYRDAQRLVVVQGTSGYDS